MGDLTERIALGKLAWAARDKPVVGKRKRVIRDAHGRLSEQWLVNGEWVTPKG
jgi:hypothetical protein